MDAAAGVDAHDAPTPACETARRAVSHKRPQPVSFLLITPLKNPEAVPTLRHASRLLHFRVTVNIRHQPLLPRPYLVLTKPLRLDIQCQRGASVKIGWKYLDD